MANPTDLRINLFLETRPDQPHAQDGPGWYVDVRRKEDVIVHARLDGREALEVGATVDAVIQDKPRKGTVQGAVQEATEGVTAALKQELIRLERESQRIGEIRKRIAEFEG